MDNRLDNLYQYCSVGTAEAEQRLLQRVYVKGDEVQDLVVPPNGSPRLIVGRKGTGKSAVMRYAAQVLSTAGVPHLLMKPMDFEFPEGASESSVGALARTAKSVILSSIAAELGKNKSGLLAGEQLALYEQAVKDGSVKRDFVGSLARFLPKIVKSLTKVELDREFFDTAETAGGLAQAIEANAEGGQCPFYLYLDDVDQVADFARPSHLNRVWSMLLAAREIARSNSIRIVIALREEVWRRLLRDDAGQRDQADHFTPLVREMSPTRRHIAAVVRRRLVVASAQAALPEIRDPYAHFFDGTGAPMPGSNERRSWEDLIVLRARERPRDAIQMIGDLAQAARTRNAEKITSEDLLRVMPEFSAQRVAMLAQELDPECPQIKEIVNSFAGVEYDQGSFKMTADRCREHLRKVPSMFGVHLLGRVLKVNNDDDMVELWKYMYDLGILNARIADNREKDGFRHIMPRDESGLVSRANWTRLQKMVWEINPAYRDYLLGRRDEEARRTGLPPRKRAK